MLININDDIIINALTLALEESSTYWVYIKDEDIDKVDNWLTQDVIKAILAKKLTFDIYDLRFPENFLGVLDAHNIHNGIVLYLLDNNGLSEELSPYESDVLLQYIVTEENGFINFKR